MAATDTQYAGIENEVHTYGVEYEEGKGDTR